MFDSKLRPVIDPVLDRVAQSLAPTALSANSVTISGFAAGIAAMAAIGLEFYLVGLILFGVNRLADGLDGAIARRHKITDLGGFLDIVLDFIIYSAIVFGFALANPDENALAAAFLIFSFIGTGGSFLAFAIMAAKRGLESQTRRRKSLFYLGGLAEGTETILIFIGLCLFPSWFPEIAYGFGLLCWLTTIGRIRIAYEALS